MKTKLKLGIIGAGSVVREIYQDLYFRSRWSPLFEVAAVADPNENRRIHAKGAGSRSGAAEVDGGHVGLPAL